MTQANNVACALNDAPALAQTSPCYLSREAVIAEIKRRYDTGLTLSWSYVVREDRALVAAAVKFFRNPSWYKAIIAANISTISVRPPGALTREKIIEEIRRCYGEGKLLSFSCNPSWRCHAKYFFGTLRLALDAAGLAEVTVEGRPRKPYSSHHWRKWTKETIQEEIVAIAAGRYGSLSRYDLRIRSRRLYGPARSFFGSWRQAVESVGLDYGNFREPGSPTSINLRRAVSLDQPIGAETTTTLAYFVGVEDPGFAAVEARQSLRMLRSRC